MWVRSCLASSTLTWKLYLFSVVVHPILGRKGMTTAAWYQSEYSINPYIWSGRCTGRIWCLFRCSGWLLLLQSWPQAPGSSHVSCHSWTFCPLLPAHLLVGGAWRGKKWGRGAVMYGYVSQPLPVTSLNAVLVPFHSPSSKVTASGSSFQPTAIWSIWQRSQNETQHIQKLATHDRQQSYTASKAKNKNSLHQNGLCSLHTHLCSCLYFSFSFESSLWQLISGFVTAQTDRSELRISPNQEQVQIGSNFLHHLLLLPREQWWQSLRGCISQTGMATYAKCGTCSTAIQYQVLKQHLQEYILVHIDMGTTAPSPAGVTDCRFSKTNCEIGAVNVESLDWTDWLSFQIKHSWIAEQIYISTCKPPGFNLRKDLIFFISSSFTQTQPFLF